MVLSVKFAMWWLMLNPLGLVLVKCTRPQSGIAEAGHQPRDLPHTHPRAPKSGGGECACGTLVYNGHSRGFSGGSGGMPSCQGGGLGDSNIVGCVGPCPKVEDPPL